MLCACCRQIEAILLATQRSGMRLEKPDELKRLGETEEPTHSKSRMPIGARLCTCRRQIKAMLLVTTLSGMRLEKPDELKSCRLGEIEEQKHSKLQMPIGAMLCTCRN